MRILREYSSEPTRLADLIKWAALVAPGVIANKNGSLQATLRYRGPDLDSATESELVTTTARLNSLLRGLPEGWVMYSEAVRAPSRNYPAAQWENPVASMIDEERRSEFESGNYYESEYYITFSWLCPEDSSSKNETWFYNNGKTENGHTKTDRKSRLKTAMGNLEHFQGRMNHILNMLSGIFPDVRALSDEETLTYLHSTVSTKQQRVAVPHTPIELDYLLTDTPVTGGNAPKIGEHYINVVTIKNFPHSTTPGILDQLNHLGFSYRWVTRFIFQGKETAEKEINKTKKALYAGRKSMMTMVMENLFQDASFMENTGKVNQALEADGALQALASDAVSFGYFTQCIVILDTDQTRLRLKSSEIERIVNGQGFISVNELDARNCLEAWLGSIPGCSGHNVRYPIINTINLAHTFPLSAVWAGPDRNTHLSDVYSKQYGKAIVSPPHLYAVTNDSVPFRLSLNIGDVGHTMVIGPTGSGKSVLLNMLELQWMRYPDAQVYVFDKGGSSRVLTAGMGGDFYDLAAEHSTLAFQPLARIDNEYERQWVHGWLLDIMQAESLTVTPATKETLLQALTLLASRPVKQRTMTGLQMLVNDPQMKNALTPYTRKGVHGDLFDKDYDNLADGRWQVFEMEELMNRPTALVHVLAYLFHRLEQRFTGAPTFLVLDEAWVFLDNPVFTAKIREWLKVLRKRNVYVIFATQSLADIAQSNIVATIKESCMSKIYLANKNALEDGIANVYRSFGLNETQIRILAFATPKRDYYYTSPDGNRQFSLGLSPLALAYCGATDKSSQEIVKQIQNAPGADFNTEYLRYLGMDAAAEYVQDSRNRSEVA